MKTFKELLDHAEQDYHNFRGKVVLATEANLVYGDETTYVMFDKPVVVKLCDSDFTSWNFQDHQNEAVLDTYYEAEAMEQHNLPAGSHIWWVYGPTYHQDGRVEPPKWHTPNATSKNTLDIMGWLD